MISNSKSKGLLLTTLQNHGEELQQLRSACEKFPALCQEALAQRENLQAEEQQLEKDTFDLETIRERMLEEECELHNQLEILTDAPAEYNKTEWELETYCLILGYKPAAFEDLENGNKLLTLNYNDYGTVTMAVSMEYDVVELLDMQPQHPNLANLKRFLDESKDTQGLLRIARKYFDFLMQSNFSMNSVNT